MDLNKGDECDLGQELPDEKKYEQSRGSCYQRCHKFLGRQGSLRDELPKRLTLTGCNRGTWADRVGSEMQFCIPRYCTGLKSVVLEAKTRLGSIQNEPTGVRLIYYWRPRNILMSQNYKLEVLLLDSSSLFLTQLPLRLGDESGGNLHRTKSCDSSGVWDDVCHGSAGLLAVDGWRDWSALQWEVWLDDDGKEIRDILVPTHFRYATTKSQHFKAGQCDCLVITFFSFTMSVAFLCSTSSI